MISIIIPTYNEVDVILDCLKSLSKQNFKDFEIVVIDDGSSDQTSQKLKNLKTPELKILKQKHLGAGAARNLGAKQAKGDILVFVDADMTFDKNFLKNLVKPITDDTSKGTFSKDEYVENWDNVWARCWNINEGWEDEKRHPRNYPDRQPVFRAVLKSEFNRVGGFTPGGYNDDWSLSKKLGYEATIAENAIFYHKNPGSLGEVFHQAVWIGKREYKLGIIGILIALIRANILFSILIGLYKGFMNYDLRFVIFKAIYDFGLTIGILRYFFTRKGAK